MSEGNGSEQIEIVQDIDKAEEADAKVDERANIIDVSFDPATQDVGVKFNNKVYRTWEFVIAVLDMAKAKCQNMQKMAQVAQLQGAQMQASMEARQNAAIAQKLKLGR